MKPVQNVTSEKIAMHSWRQPFPAVFPICFQFLWMRARWGLGGGLHLCVNFSGPRLFHWDEVGHTAVENSPWERWIPLWNRINTQSSLTTAVAPPTGSLCTTGPSVSHTIYALSLVVPCMSIVFSCSALSVTGQDSGLRLLVFYPHSNDRLCCLSSSRTPIWGEIQGEAKTL